VADGGDALEVFRGVGDALVTSMRKGGDGGGAEVVVADPGAFVVTGAFSGEGVVGGFVMSVSGGGEEFYGESEHFGVEVGVVLGIPALELFEKGGVFFVSEVVGLHGDVSAAEGFEVFYEEGLAAEGDAEFLVALGGAGGEGGGVGFEGDFLDGGEVVFAQVAAIAGS